MLPLGSKLPVLLSPLSAFRFFFSLLITYRNRENRLCEELTLPVLQDTAAFQASIDF